MCSRVAITSTSPVAISGLDFWRRSTRPSTATTNSERKLLGLGVRLGMQLLVEDNLSESGAVAQIDENQLAQIAPAMDPTHQHDVFVRVGRAQIAAIVCAFQVSKRVKQFCLPLANYARVPLLSDSRYSSKSNSESFFWSESARRFRVKVPELTSSSPMISA